VFPAGYVIDVRRFRRRCWGGGTVAGLCEAKLDGPRQVAFLEHWPLSKPHGSRNTSGWIVTLDRSAHAVSVHGIGSTPPQART
jgi:hypothetical protein